MSKNRFEILLSQMEAAKVASQRDLVGCTKQEIRQLESKYNITLPATYRRFLTVMGHKSGKLFTHDWLAVQYKHIINLTAQVPEKVRYWCEFSPDWESFTLPETALVILYRDMSDDFHFIRCDQPDDSGIWHFSPDVPQPQQIFPSVIDWLLGWCEESGQAIADGLN